MSALTRDRATPYREGIEIAYPVAQGAVIHAGSLVCVNSSGYAVPAADTAGLKLVGVAQEAVDNASGLDGATTVRVRRKGCFQFAATSITQAMVGSIMYVKDDQTFDDASTNLIVAGRLVGYESSVLGWLDIDCAVYAGAVMGASSVTVVDAGAHFPAAVDTVEEALEQLATGPFVITIPRFTGWTKDGTDKTIALPALKLPVPVRVKRAYAALGSAPGADKTLVLKLGTNTLLTVSGTDTAAADETLDIALAANAALVIKANETSGGSAANVDLMLVVALDDGE